MSSSRAFLGVATFAALIISGVPALAGGHDNRDESVRQSMLYQDTYAGSAETPIPLPPTSATSTPVLPVDKERGHQNK
jgi:hypothetical protein